MFVTFGMRNYGKIDQIRNVGYVATEFFHIQFVPLIPIRSVFVFGEKNHEAVKVQIPLSFKSVLVAWSRCVLLVFGVCQALIAGILLSEGEIASAFLPVVLTLTVVGAYAFTVMKTGIGKASQAKQEQLGEIALEVSTLSE